MTANAAESSPPSSPITMAVPDVEYIVPPPGYEDHDLVGSPESQKSQRVFKKHRVLPHPRNENGSVSSTPDSRRSSSGGQSHHTLRHQRRRISGGDLPPTPPAHSRTSSSSHSVNLSIPSPLQTPAQSSEDVPSKTNPSTPPNQRSPPTPDVTPPQIIPTTTTTTTTATTLPTARPRPPTLRPTLYDRLPSKSTTDSRSESFTTARESPVPSDEDDGRATLRPAPISTRTSQVTVRQAAGNSSEHKTSQSRLGSGIRLDSDLGDDDQADLTPKFKGEFGSFDGEWGPGGEVNQEWDGNLMRNATVGKRRPRKQAGGQEEQSEVVDDFVVTPTDAARAVRDLPLRGRILTYDDSPHEPPRRFTIPGAAAPNAEAADRTQAAIIDADIRRFSGMSSRSAASTRVEAILVETPPRPQRRTLRHVKRVDALRDSVWNPSPLSPAPTLNGARSRQFGDQTRDAPRESYMSNSTVNSVSSRKARREVWKSGGVPVVVVPDRLSSNKSSSRDHSLRSASSKRSKGSQGFGSVPLDQLPDGHDLMPYFDRPSRWEPLMSGSDGSTPGDQRTIDFPPVVPQRTSSLSAPASRKGSPSQSRDVSRNESRAGSLTAESLRAHNAMQAKLANGVSPVPSARVTNHIAGEPSSNDSGGQGDLPVVTVDAAPSLENPKSSEGSEGRQRHLESGPCDPLHSTKATPFSQTSVETSVTSAADIGEARAVSMVPHKIKDVVMVAHRPSESSDGDPRSPFGTRPDRPIIMTTEADGVTTKVHEEEPITPPQGKPTLNNVDSPLRNPRMPPEPPAIQLHPATPSGLTPAEEKTKMLGNFYEELDEEPALTPSVVRRAMRKRRHSTHGPSPARKPRPNFLTRTFSLSRNIRKDTAEASDSDYALPSGESGEIDETRLHPDWRPSYYARYYNDDDDGVYDLDREEERGMRRYHTAGSRPAPLKRTLSERMKRTFAIMPLQDVYDRDSFGPPDRRTLARTDSGTLRVVKKRGSIGTLRARKSKRKVDEEEKNRPSTSPDAARRVPFWPRSNSVRSQNRRDGVPDREREREGERERFMEKMATDRATPPRTSETRKWSVSQNIGTLTRRLSEKRREKRSNELRQKISGPREVRDGVGDVIRREGFREAFTRPRRMRDDVYPGAEGEFAQ
ncbi:hypothetical protein VM1G_09887 [Cytospora mali]|uniref:Uncharacterized protein n=1 Tax=Cytospora mali TaxID=578113 RepID=A0A194WCK9_CYTMA|nr:hypothetical protein VM1G_09887 [Valsa mali]